MQPVGYELIQGRRTVRVDARQGWVTAYMPKTKRGVATIARVWYSNGQAAQARLESWR